MADQPLFVVLAGPNGAGKSTAAAVLLEPSLTFVNADEIAKGLSGYPSRSVDLEAGRIALERMERLEETRADFAFETTLASRALASRIKRLKTSGYHVRLLYVWSPSAEFSLFRVAARVQSGGHDVPAETIRRRYRASMINFQTLYRPIVDRWIVYDNSGRNKPRAIATGVGLSVETVADPDLWSRFEKGLSSDA
jgi:predicted ABC-type ATPase